jgi:hypothetical protein
VRRTVRQEQSRPLIEALEPWLRAKLETISQKTKPGGGGADRKGATLRGDNSVIKQSAIKTAAAMTADAKAASTIHYPAACLERQDQFAVCFPPLL